MDILNNEVCVSQKMKPDNDHQGMYNANEVSV